MTDAATQQQVQFLEYGVHKRQVLVVFLWWTALFGGWMVIGPELLLSRPLDYVRLAFPVALWLTVYLGVGFFVSAWTSRQKITLRPDGIVTHIGFIAWPWVVGVAASWPVFGRGVILILADGRKVPLRAPVDTRLWGASPAFAAQLAEIREYALRHGARIDAPTPRPWWISAIFGSMAAVVLTGVVYLPLTRPIVTPWTPTAVSLPDACTALERAGLDQHWPAATRELESKDKIGDSMHDEHDCSWGRTYPDEAEPPPAYGGVSVKIMRYHTGFGSSGVAEAMDDIAWEREGSGGDQVAELNLASAEEAVVTFNAHYPEAKVVARRGDVTVELAVEPNSDAREWKTQARRVAADLTAGVLRQIRFE